MVAIRAGEADAFLARPNPSIAVFLVHGPDAGLVSERVRQVITASTTDPTDPFQLVRLSSEGLADRSRLVDEVMTRPLFGERRIVHVEHAGAALVPALETILTLPLDECRIVIEAGLLKRDAPLRRLVEPSRIAVAIECTPDDDRDLAALVETHLERLGLMIAEDARDALVDLLGDDRLVTRSELDKLALYAHGAAEVDLAAVRAVIADASVFSTDDVVDDAFLGRSEAVVAGMARVAHDRIDGNVVVAAAARHAVALHRCALSPGDGAAMARAGVPARRRSRFERQLRLWRAPDLAGVIRDFAHVQRRVRLMPVIGYAILDRALLNVASQARKGQKGR